MRIRPGSFTARRRSLRQPGTDAERLLWQHLRARQTGGKFRRQHSIGPYILDFYCADAGLAVEVDGDQHAVDGEQRRHDERRTEYLTGHGIRVIRFSDRQVLTETMSVLETIVAALT